MAQGRTDTGTQTAPRMRYLDIRVATRFCFALSAQLQNRDRGLKNNCRRYRCDIQIGHACSAGLVSRSRVNTTPSNPPNTTSFPYPFSNYHFSPSFLQFTLVHNFPPPKLDNLHFWGSQDLRQALVTYLVATVCSTDGCDDPQCETPSGSAATFNTLPPINIFNTSFIKGPYPAETFAIILITLF